jgi:uncharacterized membrane protein
MIKHKTEIVINRPVNQVFAYMTETQHLPDWQPGLIKAENMSGAPWQAGTRLRERRTLGGRQIETVSEISALNPEQGFTVRSLTGPQTNGEFRLETVKSGTRVRFAIQLQMSGFMRLAEPFIAKELKQQADNSLVRLKQLVEMAK